MLGATLTLLSLLIGFSFSMAVNWYDLGRNYEEAEANAIGTEYVRTDLLPDDSALRVRDLLKQYPINAYRARRTDRRMLLILPIAVSIAFFLISDIDSPRGGTIGVAPENLISLAHSLRIE